jgi:hypothetical protein
MANEKIDDATRKVPPDKAWKNKKISHTGRSNKPDAERVKKDELIDDRFQATDN